MLDGDTLGWGLRVGAGGGGIWVGLIPKVRPRGKGRGAGVDMD